MAPAYVKSLFSSCEHTSRYTLLPTSGNSDAGNASRAPSLESSTSSTLEKAQISTPSAPSRSLRVDARIISDATIGLSDGLTVPFALTAGLSALGDTRLVIYAGLAELIAGGISMGLGGYLGASGEAQAYQATLTETRTTISQDQTSTHDLITSTFAAYPLSADLLDTFATQLLTSPTATEAFLMQFHHQLPPSASAPSRAYISALTISLGYILGGLTPLLPYFVCETNRTAFWWSVGVMVLALLGFGVVKTVLVGERGWRERSWGGLQMVLLGGVAAGAAMGCVALVGS